MENFSSMPDHARTWIYAANKAISEKDKELILSDLHQFTQSWTAHDQPLKAEASILYNQFVILMVDETRNEVGGCGIDNSIQFMKDLGEKYGLDFFNRLLIHVQNENGIETYTKQSLQDAIDRGLVNPETKVFNNVVHNKSDFLDKWVQSLESNWISKQLKFSARV